MELQVFTTENTPLAKKLAAAIEADRRLTHRGRRYWIRWYFKEGWVVEARLVEEG